MNGSTLIEQDDAFCKCGLSSVQSAIVHKLKLDIALYIMDAKRQNNDSYGKKACQQKSEWVLCWKIFDLYEACSESKGTSLQTESQNMDYFR